MKKHVLTVVASIIATSLLWLLMGAALPAPIWRNNFSTNEPPFPVIGNWIYSNGVAGVGGETNFIRHINTVSAGVDAAGTPAWQLGRAGYAGANALILLSSPDPQITITATNGTIPAIRVFEGAPSLGAPNLTSNSFVVYDSSGNPKGFLRTNAFWATTNDFFAILTTTDNTTNNIFTFVPRDNSVVRVKVDTVGYNSTASASYGKLGTFKSVAGVVTQVGATATLGLAEDDAAYECLLDTSANIIRVRVAGDIGKTINWKTYVNTTYSE